jgi:hypothetical protein
MMFGSTFLTLIIGFIGVVLAVGITVGVVLWIRRPLKKLLSRLIADEHIVDVGATFVQILLALRGLSVALGYIEQPLLSEVLSGLTRLLNALADDVQWAAWISALLFIGFSLRQRQE